MIIDYQANNASLCQSDKRLEGWNRFNSTSSGLIVTSCPGPTQCGCDQQIWINDTLPSQDNGTSRLQFCLRSSQGCCSRQSIMDVKNCGSYVVFRGFFHTGSRICFENSSVTLPQPTTTPTPTPTVSLTTEIKHVSGTLFSRTVTLRSVNVTLIARTSLGETTDLTSSQGLMRFTHGILFGMLIGIAMTLTVVLIVVLIYKNVRKRGRNRVQSTESILSSIYTPDKNAKTKFMLRIDNGNA